MTSTQTDSDSVSVQILKSLADDVRLGIAKHLATQKHPVPSAEVVQSCAHRLELSQPAMSHHFKKLVEAGVIDLEKHGTENFYRLNRSLCKDHGIDVTKL